jgi:hypothetical protein
MHCIAALGNKESVVACEHLASGVANANQTLSRSAKTVNYGRGIWHACTTEDMNMDYGMALFRIKVTYA